MSLYLPLHQAFIADNQDSLLNGKLHGKNPSFLLKINSLLRGEAMLVRGDNQVSLVFIQNYWIAANNHMVPGLEMGALTKFDFWSQDIYIYIIFIKANHISHQYLQLSFKFKVKNKGMFLLISTTNKIFPCVLSLLVEALVCLYWYYLWILFLPRAAGNNAKVGSAIHIPLPQVYHSG